MADLVYDDEKHEYWIGRKRLGSLSEILKVTGIYQENHFVSDHDMWVGSAAHKVIELHIKGTLDPASVDTQLIPRLEAYRKFEKTTGFKAIATEKKVYSEMFGIAARIDVLGYFPNKIHGIIELKSGAVGPATAIQTAIQWLALNQGLETIRRFGLQIGKEGKANLVEFTNPKDPVVAMAAITIYNWLRNNGRIK